MRSGYVDPNYSRLGDAGISGDYWSGRALSSDLAYELFFYSSSVDPSLSSRRYLGYSVRCVAGWE